MTRGVSAITFQVKMLHFTDNKSNTHVTSPSWHPQSHSFPPTIHLQLLYIMEGFLCMLFKIYSAITSLAEITESQEMFVL